MDELRAQLRRFMNERDLTLQEVAILTNRHYSAIWKFLHNKTKPNETTIYKIKKLLGRNDDCSAGGGKE